MRDPRNPGFVEPRSLVFWVFIGLIVLGGYWQVTDTFDKWGDHPDGIVIGTVVWLVYGVVVGWFIYRLQRFERRPATATVAAVAWGVLLAGGLTAIAGADLRSILDKILGFETSAEWGAAIRAPFVEETTKYLGVVALALIPKVRISRVIDGIYYGMLSGLGFVVSENLLFSNQAISVSGGEGIGDEIFGVMLTRGIASLPLSHVVYTGIAGAGVGYFMSRRDRPAARRVAVAGGLYAAAFVLHGFQNSPILDDLAFNIFVKGIPALIVFLIVLRWGRREYRRDLRAIADGLQTVSGEDLEVLATKRRRKKAAKRADDPDRAIAAQQAQIDLLVAADIYGADAPETRALAGANTGAG